MSRPAKDTQSKHTSLFDVYRLNGIKILLEKDVIPLYLATPFRPTLNIPLLNSGHIT